ncbi:MAG TPA: YHS domain-containing (seleno)protein [Phnomibacter sp.]|nr:YHS domain-containing (seleno)protein [Phnomibacter sp.]
MKAMMNIAVGLLMLTACTGQSTRPLPKLNVKDGLAIKGYDVVAYFTEGRPVKGLPSFSHTWEGATWYFSGADNLEAFKAGPYRYAPQYGGFCAYGASKGYLADTDPNAWTIIGEKLYLNYSMKVRTEWLKDTSDRIAAADKYWNTIIK